MSSVDVLFFKDELYPGKLKNKDIPIDTSIILCLDPKSKRFNKNVVKACKNNFKYPVISSKFHIAGSLESEQLPYPHLFMYIKYNHNFGKQNKEWKNTLNLVKFTIRNYIYIHTVGDSNCQMWITLDNDTIKYLQNYTKKYKFKLKEKTEQREISGKFLCYPIGDKSIVLKIDEITTDLGNKEEVGYFDTIASFHTHPFEAYERYNICLAYPSVDDYATFLYIYANGYGSFHIVSTVEGIYVITISDLLLSASRETILKEFDDYEKSIKQNYGVVYPSCAPSRDAIKKDKLTEVMTYVDTINKKPYFNLKFVEWGKAHKPINITYGNINNNCLLLDEQVRVGLLLKE